MQRISALTSISLAVLILALAPSVYAQDGQYLIDENGNYVSASAPAPAQGQSHGQSQAQPQGPDGLVTVTNPATGETYKVRAHNAAAVRSQQPALPAQASPAIPMRSIPWRDPAEGAFTVSLPANWRISGGTVRTTQMEPHYVIRAQSPSGGVQMFMDDPNIAIRQVPGWGTREGQVIPSAWGGRILVQRYQPAPMLAQEYVRRRYCPSATGFQGGIVPGQTQDLNQEFGPIAQAEGKRVHIDVGEVSFRCGQQDGYVYAITLQAWQQGGPVSLWLVYRIAGYLAQPRERGAAASAMHELLETFQMDQGWLQRFAQQAGDLAGNVIRESNAVTQSTIDRAQQMDAQMAADNAAWKARSDANFNAIEHTDRAIAGAGSNGSGNGHNYNAQLGTKTVCDDLGRCQTVNASVNTYYSDCSGTFYPGTTSGEAPSSSLSACWNKGQ